ncbi:hypothetical protein J3R83DRAFT_10362 [Lanmaoa asiatica]|nr:hypothetical protein J3R83DRAFT_10362 [Lanmaoa asiatica]
MSSPSTMSSHQDPYYYSDSSPEYYESGSEPPVARHLRYPVQSWTPVATSGDQSGYSQPHQSLDSVGNLLEVHEAEDMRYSLNHPHPNYPAPSTFQDTGLGTDATYTNDNIPFPPLANLPFYDYSDYDYRHPQYPSVYTPCGPAYGYPEQPFEQDVSQSGHHAQDMHTSQASQGPSAHVYAQSLSTQLVSLDCGGPVYQADTGAARPTPDNLALDVVNTVAVELPNAGTIQYSHPSPVATSPSNQTSAPGPSRPLPSSPERKRPWPTTAADEGSTARRVMPRHDRAWSVHSTSSDSHRRGRNNDIYGRGPLIPQERYTTNSISSYNTPDQHPPINFDLENPDQFGIPITDILNNTDSFTRIRDRTQAFSHMGKKTFTLRVQWPGYRPWSKTLAALDWTKSRDPITRVKLAEAVAKGVRDLIVKYRDEPYDPDYVEWNVGPNGIQFDQICLVALHHVSRGSWQPKLCLREPRR